MLLKMGRLRVSDGPLESGAKALISPDRGVSDVM
jgi:hypothetical protein